MTTIPSRIDQIRPVVEAILNQTIRVEGIEINVPLLCLRTRELYKIPPWFSEVPLLHVVRTDDWGPITKIAPTLMRHRHDDMAVVWSVDDDCAYPSYQLGLLLDHYSADNRRILTRHGGLLSEDGDIKFLYGTCPVDMFEGFGGVLYPPNCIDDDFEPFVRSVVQDPDCRKSDDLVLSHYFKRKGFEILLVNNPTDDIPFMPTGFQPYSSGPDALSVVDGGHIAKYKRVYRHLRDKYSHL
jgi:hypothetical protein